SSDLTFGRTTFPSQSPAPASSVSRTCSSNESSSLITQAIPPCANAVFESAPLRFVITATDPCFAAFKAKLSPAMPLPITTKSYCFMMIPVADLFPPPSTWNSRAVRFWQLRHVAFHRAKDQNVVCTANGIVLVTVLPASSDTVRRTLYKPGTGKRLDGFCANEKSPSSNVHAYCVMLCPGDTAVAENATLNPGAPVLGSAVTEQLII